MKGWERGERQEGGEEGERRSLGEEEEEKKIVVKTKMYIIHENCNQEKYRYGKANQITKMKPRKFWLWTM